MPERGASEETGIEQLERRVRSCNLCRLSGMGNGPVFPISSLEGSEVPVDGTCIVMVMDHPGWFDDRDGVTLADDEVRRRFCRDLKRAGIDASRVWVTSLVRCRPARGRSALPDEVETCEGYLFQELKLVKPAIVCPMGASALRVLTGRALRMSQAHGIPLSSDIHGRQVKILPIMNPAIPAIVPALTPLFLDAMKTLSQMVGVSAGARGDANVNPSATLEASGNHDQTAGDALTLFELGE